jgi:hypothetical protein
MMKIKQDSILHINYLTVLKDRVFKILPLVEEENDGLFKYIDSLVFELHGLQYVIDGLMDSHNYLSLLATLESIQDELIVQNKDSSFIRSEIFRSLGTVDKLIQKGE